MKDYTIEIQRNDEFCKLNQSGKYDPTLVKHPTIEIPTMTVRFTLSNSGNYKLQLVKAVKLATGLGLKQSKDIVAHQQITFLANMTFQELEKFREYLNDTNAEFELDDREKIRNRKLISLGLGTKSDIIEELVDLDIQKIFKNKTSVYSIQEILKTIYSHIEEEKIKEIYESYIQ
jgi:hypothetical protein